MPHRLKVLWLRQAGLTHGDIDDSEVITLRRIADMNMDGALHRFQIFRLFNRKTGGTGILVDFLSVAELLSARRALFAAQYQ